MSVSMLTAAASADDGASKIPKNFFAVGRDRTLTVSWVNPARDDIESIRVYREDGSEPVVDTDNLGATSASVTAPIVVSTDASAANYFMMAEPNDQYHSYNIEIAYSDGSVYRGGAISNKLHDYGTDGFLWGGLKTSQEIDGWSNAAAGTPYVKVSVQTDVVHSGSAAMLVRQNAPELSNTFFEYGPDLKGSFEDGKTYKFSYWRKGINAGWYAVGLGGRWGDHLEETLGTSDWEKKERIWTIGESKSENGQVLKATEAIRFQFNRATEAMYIDDCELYELDADGNPIGDNMLVNGDFEQGDLTPPPAATDARAVIDDNGNATISWMKSSDVEYTNIYSYFEGELNLIRATSQASVTIPGQEIGDEYIIKTSDAFGNESEGVTVTTAGVNIAPKNFFAVGRDRGLSVSWKNPEREDIVSITVYDENGGIVCTDADETVSTQAGANCYYDVSGLENGRKYIFRIKLTFANGEEFTGECMSNVLNDYGMWDIIGNPKETQYVYGWSSGASGQTHNKFTISTDEFRSGQASLLICSNVPAAISDTFQRLHADHFELDADTTYRISFYAKTVNAGLWNFGKEGGRWSTPSIGNQNEATHDWKKYTLDFQGGNGHMIFELGAPYEAIYIDDATLYALDENSEPTGENLLINGGLEAEPGLAREEVKNVNATSQNGVTTITWDPFETDNVTEIRIYEEYEGNNNVVKVLRGDAVSAELNSVCDRYLVSTVNSCGAESAKILVNTEILQQDAEYSEISLTDNLDYFTATVSVRNNARGDDFKPSLYIAVYDSNGDLAGVNCVSETIPVGESREISVSADYDWLDTSTIKAFLWDSMMPLIMNSMDY